jgi:hypothetical protein
MTLTKGQYYILFLAVISFLLLSSVFKWINYLIENKYIAEGFQQLNNEKKRAAVFGCLNEVTYTKDRDYLNQ